MVEYGRIKAPFNGVITQRNISPGDYLQPGGGNNGRPLFVLEQVDPVRVFVGVPELASYFVHDHDTALIRFQAIPGVTREGKVVRSGFSLNPSTRTLQTEIDIPNADGHLHPGWYVTVSITIDRKQVWTLPSNAIGFQGGQNYFVYFQVDGKPVRTPVIVGSIRRHAHRGHQEVCPQRQHQRLALSRRDRKDPGRQHGRAGRGHRNRARLSRVNAKVAYHANGPAFSLPFERGGLGGGPGAINHAAIELSRRASITQCIALSLRRHRDAVHGLGLDDLLAQRHQTGTAFGCHMISDLQARALHALRLHTDEVARIEDHAVGHAMSVIVDSFDDPLRRNVSLSPAPVKINVLPSVPVRATRV